MTRARRHFTAPIRALAQRPRSVLTASVAAGSTSVLLALAFVSTIQMLPGPRPHLPFGALVVGFLVGSAAGSAIPMPAGVGSVETALVAVLASSGVPTAHAVEVVLVYRLLTFWLPAAFGLLAARHLRRAGAL